MLSYCVYDFFQLFSQLMVQCRCESIWQMNVSFHQIDSKRNIITIITRHIWKHSYKRNTFVCSPCWTDRHLSSSFLFIHPACSVEKWEETVQTYHSFNLQSKYILQTRGNDLLVFLSKILWRQDAFTQGLVQKKLFCKLKKFPDTWTSSFWTYWMHHD